jgi:hypothetical protein
MYSAKNVWQTPSRCGTEAIVCYQNCMTKTSPIMRKHMKFPSIGTFQVTVVLEARTELMIDSQKWQKMKTNFLKNSVKNVCQKAILHVSKNRLNSFDCVWKISHCIVWKMQNKTDSATQSDSVWKIPWLHSFQNAAHSVCSKKPTLYNLTMFEKSHDCIVFNMMYTNWINFLYLTNITNMTVTVSPTLLIWRSQFHQHY